MAVEVLQAVAAADQLGLPGAGADRLVHLVRQGRGAMARVDRNLVGVRVALEHRQLAGCEFVFVLLGVGGGDGEQRFFIGERVSEKTSAVHGCRTGFKATVPGRNAAVGVAFFLCAQGRQGGAQLRRFLFADGGQDVAGQQGERQRADGVDHACFHGCTLCRLRLRS
ncbi:hypothetical protein D3C76_1158790 [compost metagenome]